MSAAGLVEFIRARLDEDEAVAKAADVKQGDPEWFVSPVMATGGEHFTVRSKDDSRPIARVQRLDGDDDEPGGILDGAAVAEHIARHDPARVLAEVEAKRRIIELHERVKQRHTFDRIGHEPEKVELWTCAVCCDDRCPTWEDRGMLHRDPSRIDCCETVPLLAEPYDWHSDYREDWRP